jgi:hypothetical protein
MTEVTTPHPRAAHYRAAFGAFEAAVTSAVDDLLAAIDAGFASPDRVAELNGCRLALGGLDAAPGPGEEEAINAAAATGLQSLLARVEAAAGRLSALPTRLARGLRDAARAGDRDSDCPSLIAADFADLRTLDNPANTSDRQAPKLCGLWHSLPASHWARTAIPESAAAPHPVGRLIVLDNAYATPAGPFDLRRVRGLTNVWRELLEPWEAERQRAAAEARARQEAAEQVERERMEADPQEQIKLLKARLAALEAAA